MKHLKITTAELAKICNVSQGTVDRALNNRSDINAQTKQKVISVAKQYGYREYAHSLNPDNPAGLIGIIVFNLENEYFSKLITEIEFILRQRGFGAVVMMTHYDKQSEIECIRNMYNMGVLGIILCSVNSGTEFCNYLKIFDLPVVAVGNNIGGIPYVGIDDFAAMKEFTEKILKDGYENLIYFSPALNYPDAYAQRARYEGFIAATTGEKIQIVTKIDDIKDEYDEKTAIVCSTDYYALNVYFKARNVKVVGFDDIDAIKKYNLSIDSVGSPMTLIAQNAVDTIVQNKREDVFIKHFIIEHSG